MKTVEDFQLWLSNFESGIVNITDEITLDTYQMIKDVERMKHGTYLNPKYPDGMDKIIYNLGQILHFTLFRFSDKDAKELDLVPLTDDGIRNISFFKAMLRGYLNDSSYDKVMNRDRRLLIDGHLITLELNNKSHPIKLLNVVRDWSNPDFEETGGAFKTFPTKASLKEMLDDMEDGKAKKQLKEIMEDNKITDDKIMVYQWWTEDEFDGKETKGCIKYLDVRRIKPDDVKQDNSDWSPFIELERFETPATRVVVDQEEIDFYKEKGLLENGNRVPAYPVKEARLFEREGHALGYGVWLVIQGLIEHHNENWNDTRRHTKGAAKGAYVYTRRSRDRSITQEFLNSLDMNAVLEIKPGEDVKNFPIQSITQEHLLIADKLFELARQTLGIHASAVIQPKASQSATSAAYEQENAKSTYAIIGEIMNLYYQELFRDFKIPSIIEHLSKQRTIKLMGTKEEIDDIDDKLITNTLYAQLKNSKAPFSKSALDAGEEARLKTALKKSLNREGTTRFIPKLKKKVLELFQYDIMFYAGSTVFDKREKLNIYNNMISEAIQNPNSKYSADKIQDVRLDLLGVDGKRFEKSPEEIQKEQMAMQAMQQQQANIPNTSIL